MDYTIRVDTAMWGDAIPLAYIARAMATHAACSHGNQPFHEPTFQNVYPRHVSRLLDAAKGGKLSVCDYDGRIAGAQELIDTSQMLPVANDDGPNANDIFALYVKRRHLSEWAGIEGDSFNFIDAPSDPIVFDLKNERGEVIKAGYFRGYVGSVASLLVPTAATHPLSTLHAAPLPSGEPALGGAPLLAMHSHSSVVGAVPWAPASVSRNKLRTNSLDAPIKKAIAFAGSLDAGAVWLELRALAMEEEKPFTGVVEGSARCYTNDNNAPSKLSRDALRKRLKNHAVPAPK
jgi:hypothetical protein